MSATGAFVSIDLRCHVECITNQKQLRDDNDPCVVTRTEHDAVWPGVESSRDSARARKQCHTQRSDQGDLAQNHLQA
jgi:hypothetical protein